jgi:hypothetical protein
LITTFGHPEAWFGRRQKFLDWMKAENISVLNINDANEEELRGIYDKAKIMVNIHQTQWHHTFEEFRVLPALLRKVVVISELVPMKELIPYYEYVIWCSYQDMPKIIRETQRNYAMIWNRLFSSSDFESLIEEMTNRTAIELDLQISNFSRCRRKRMNWANFRICMVEGNPAPVHASKQHQANKVDNVFSLKIPRVIGRNIFCSCSILAGSKHFHPKQQKLRKSMLRTNLAMKFFYNATATPPQEKDRMLQRNALRAVGSLGPRSLRKLNNIARKAVFGTIARKGPFIFQPKSRLQII